MNTKHTLAGSADSAVIHPSRPLFSRFKVSQRITMGFAAALGLAFGGTSVGVLIGNFYQDRATVQADSARQEVSLLSQLQAGVLQSRTHQQQLIPLAEFPEDFREEYSHIIEHGKTIDSVWQQLIAFDSTDHTYPAESDSSLSIYELIETYDGVATNYIEELSDLVESIRLESLDTSASLLITQRQLLTFTNSDLAIAFDGISDDLSGMIASANDKFAVAQQAKEQAYKLRNRIILASMLLSSATAALLIFLISRSINRPLAALEETAVLISENDSFDLRAAVTGEDEVGTVATSFNLLLNRVESLLCEQKLEEEDLEAANHKLVSTQTQMIAQEKLASLGSLTAGIAHEIKNPLNFVNNFAELSVELAEELTEEFDAQKDQLDPEFLADVLDIVAILQGNVSKIEHHGKRADKIVANMLQHSRNGDSEWSEVNINDLIAEAINLAYHGMRAKHSDFNLDFDTDYEEGLPLVSVSPQDLSRVFLNIASNACYAIYQRQLSEGPSYQPLLKVRTRQQADQVAVFIRDNGPGMSPDVKNKVFDQFFTTKPSGEGTGLGLSLSYNIVVEQHKGSMTVESEEGVYTDFVVTIPV